MKFKKDKHGNEYTSQAGAADYVGMARSSFQYLYKGIKTFFPTFARIIFPYFVQIITHFNVITFANVMFIFVNYS